MKLWGITCRPLKRKTSFAGGETIQKASQRHTEAQKWGVNSLKLSMKKFGPKICCMGLKTALKSMCEFSAIFSFLMAVCYVPYISGSATTGRWAMLACLPLVMTRPRLTAVNVLALGCLLVAVLWTKPHWDSVQALCIWLIISGIYCARLDLRGVYVGMAYGVGISCLIAIPQHFLSWKGIEQAIYPAGLFINKNFLAETALLCLIPMAMQRKWAISAVLLIGIAITETRAVYLAAVVTGIVWLWPRSRYLAVAAIAVSVNAAIYYWQLGTPLYTLLHRFQIWQDTISGVSVAGHGTGMFRPLFPSFAANTDTLFSRPNYAHNEALHMAFEWGIAALIWAAFYAMLLVRANETERLILVAFAVIAAFGFPARLPATAFMLAVVAAHIGNAGPDLRDSLANWRGFAGLWRLWRH